MLAAMPFLTNKIVYFQIQQWLKDTDNYDDSDSYSQYPTEDKQI